MSKLRDRTARIRARLEQIAARNDGRLEAGVVVKDAKNPKSPLHAEFEWDDTEAAKKWRLEQARVLIRSVKVEVLYTSISIAAPMYVHDVKQESGYVETVSLRDDKDRAMATLAREMRQAVAYLRRCESIATELGLSESFADMLTRVMSFYQKVNKAA